MVALSDIWREARLILSRVHPAGARWHRFLGSLPLDPSLLARPLPEPGSNDFIICGCPRSGTTLLAGALFQPPKLITVVEPWEGMRKAPSQLFRDLRRRMEHEGVVSSGRLDLEALSQGQVKRVAEGASKKKVPFEQGWLLGVKWPTYWQYLDLLRSTRFLICVRDPLDVVASFKAQGGRLGVGLCFDTPFNRRLNEGLIEATRDPAVRRALLYERINSSILPHLDRKNVFLVRYERWWEDRACLLQELADFLGTSLTEFGLELRRSSWRAALTSRELSIIRNCCPSATRLGYQLGEPAVA